MRGACILQLWVTAGALGVCLCLRGQGRGVFERMSGGKLFFSLIPISQLGSQWGSLPGSLFSLFVLPAEQGEGKPSQSEQLVFG